MPSGAERLLTVREVAERLAICTATVYRLCERGDLLHVRVSNAIRVRPADVDAFLARGQGSDPVVPGSRPYSGPGSALSRCFIPPCPATWSGEEICSGWAPAPLKSSPPELR
ncbi:MAG: DNA-binding protein [Myxococcaceae bacterium]|nr:MAG: DNA-binding protein [Myxococcaceae bacterium]